LAPQSLPQLQLKAFKKTFANYELLLFNLTRQFSLEVIKSMNNVKAFVIYLGKIALNKGTKKSFESV
jgi:hypothetical protein